MITGRCYCGGITVHADTTPLSVTYCHCSDCRRLTGAPVAAFAAFASTDVHLTPEPAESNAVPTGIRRWFCPDCGSALAAQFDYLPGQTYVPVGILDQAGDYPPTQHAHHGSRLPWLTIADDTVRIDGTSRDRLNAASEPETCG